MVQTERLPEHNLHDKTMTDAFCQSCLESETASSGFAAKAGAQHDLDTVGSIIKHTALIMKHTTLIIKHTTHQRLAPLGEQ